MIVTVVEYKSYNILYRLVYYTRQITICDTHSVKVKLVTYICDIHMLKYCMVFSWRIVQACLWWPFLAKMKKYILFPNLRTNALFGNIFDVSQTYYIILQIFTKVPQKVHYFCNILQMLTNHITSQTFVKFHKQIVLFFKYLWYSVLKINCVISEKKTGAGTRWQVIFSKFCSNSDSNSASVAYYFWFA